jgi:monoamine oxidase
VQQQSVIIVGGGIAGLIAAKLLSAKQKHVVLIEGRERLGGRINTILPDNLPGLVLECGAEFIHGNLPLTFEVLNAYGIPFYKVEGQMVNLTKEGSSIHEGASWNKLMDKMAALNKDVTLSDLLDEHFPGKKNNSFKNSIKQFASGFDLADPVVASSKVLYREWNGESDDQYRIEGGYKKIIDALHNDCERAGCEIHMSSVVKKIIWSKGSVSVLTEKGETFTGDKALITVPAGVLQDETKRGFIHFLPPIPRKTNAFRSIGFGSVIKLFLLFKEDFWKSRYKNPGFFFTPHFIPTWWTQEPKKNNLLIGWLGGKASTKWSNHNAAEILELALESLAFSFDLPKLQVNEMLLFSKIVDWGKEEFTYGGYSFSLPNSQDAKKELHNPKENTIYFAGEALYEGPMQGTVEAALKTGTEAAEKILTHYLLPERIDSLETQQNKPVI